MKDLNETTVKGNTVIGNTVVVNFLAMKNSEIEAKVDTGATISSLHAENIKIQNKRVSFDCPELSDNTITMNCDMQDVLTADGGNNTRPVVDFDIDVNGVHISNATFNLNDRSEMDCPILIGQNILKTGNFVIDVNQTDEPNQPTEEQTDRIPESADSILNAIKVLVEHNITIDEFVSLANKATNEKE